MKFTTEELLSGATELLRVYGPESFQVRDFLFKHQENTEFTRLFRTALWVHKQLDETVAPPWGKLLLVYVFGLAFGGVVGALITWILLGGG